MARICHRNLTLPAVLFASALFVCASPVRCADLPPNVIDHDLGESGSNLSIRLVHVPYYLGDQLVVEATVRNTETRARLLPEPRGLFIAIDEAPDTTMRDFSGMRLVRHSCRFQVSADPSSGCLKWLQEHSVRLGPGETRSRRWVSPSLGQYGLPLKGQAPKVFGLRFSSHNVLPDRWVRFAVHRLRDPIRGQLLRHPVHKYRSFFFTAPAGPGRFVVLSHGAWYRDEGPWQVFDAATLNSEAERWPMPQDAVVSHPDPTIAYDTDGTLLVDGQRAVHPRYRFEGGHSGSGAWALRAGEKPGENDSNKNPVTEDGW